eukprot:SAG11_NODE_15852_length_564_cov_1.305376_1_plen_45_part_10
MENSLALLAVSLLGAAVGQALGSCVLEGNRGCLCTDSEGDVWHMT